MPSGIPKPCWVILSVPSAAAGGSARGAVILGFSKDSGDEARAIGAAQSPQGVVGVFNVSGGSTLNDVVEWLAAQGIANEEVNSVVNTIRSRINECY